MLKKSSHNKPKVAFFIPSLEGGGAERVFLTIANEFVRKGIKVDVILIRNKGSYLEELDSEVTIISAKFSNYPGGLLCLYNYIMKERPDAVFSTIWYCNFFNILISQLTGKKNICIVRECIYPKQFYDSKPIWSRWIYKIYWLSYRWADYVICPSKAIGEYFIKVNSVDKQKLKVISNPVDIDGILNKSIAPVKHKWFENKNIKVIVSIGRLDSQKGYDKLIKACARITIDNWRLIILGEGAERSSLEYLIKQLQLQDKIELPGFISNPYSYMKYADIFILSSLFEGMPNVLIEALTCNASIISTNCDSGPAEILENGRLGILTEVDDIASMSNAINSMFENKINFPTADVSKYNVHIIADQYLSLIS